MFHFDSFISFLKNEKRVSPHTVESYGNDVDQFLFYLKTDYSTVQDVSEISAQMVRSWMSSLKSHQVSSRSIRRKVSSLNAYFRFLMVSKSLEKSPMQKIALPKLEKKLPEFLPEKNIDRLFENIEYAEGFQGMTHKLVLEILYQCGLRRAELLSLKVKNIDFQKNEMKVLGKRNKERIIPMGYRLSGEIQQYLTERRTLEIPDSEFLLVTEKGRELYPKYIYNVVHHYLNQVSTLHKKSPHILRHTFATHLLNNGAELNAVKELLGHANLSATQIYTHNSFEKLKSVHKKAHPKS